MLSASMKALSAEYPTPESQQAQLKTLIASVPEITDLSILKNTIVDILTLIQLLSETNPGIGFSVMGDTQKALAEAYNDKNKPAIKKLTYTLKCISGFNPLLLKKAKEFFASKMGVSIELISVEPKPMGQQSGCIVKIYKHEEDKNPKAYFVKTHQDFSSKSHSTFLVTPSEGSGLADFKELFMYKVLEYLGFGPKTLFFIGVGSAIEESVLIATQDLSFTKRPTKRRKSFEMFAQKREVLSEAGATNIDLCTTRDIVIIDMLSRAFLLDDVMANMTNFGMVSSTSATDPANSGSKPKIKWKILDFMPPKLRKTGGDDYSYRKHYPGGIDIFHSFRVGNASHTYDSEGLEIICEILAEENSSSQWEHAIKRLITGTEKHLPLEKALEQSFQEVMGFMKANQEALEIEPERLDRRMKDLERYKTKAFENFQQLAAGVSTHLTSKSDETATPT